MKNASLRHYKAVVAFTNRNRAVDTSRCAENEVDILLMEASEPDIGADEFISLIRAFVAHLREERLQQQVVAKKLIPDILDMVVRTYSSNPFHGTSLIDRCPKRLPLEPKDEIGLSRCRDGLIASLSDVSATPAFAKEHPVDSDLVDTLCAWFSVDEPSIQRCACLMIGNLARSDAVCKDMVHRMGLHELLITILVKSNDLQLLHATLGFLRNLALRVENKGTIAGSNVLEPLSKIWASSSSPQLQYEAVRVVRQLVNGSLANIQRLLMPLAWGENADDNSYVSQLVALFRQTDEVPTKFEISRTMAAIWRCVRSPASTQYFSDIVEVILPRLHSMTAELAKPLSAMVTQTRWPVIKSEGWFALALMARSKEGSDAIINQLSEAELSNALIGVIGARKAVPKENISVATGNEVSITGADTSDLKPEPKEVMETKDGDNALVLVTELLKNSVSRSTFYVFLCDTLSLPTCNFVSEIHGHSHPLLQLLQYPIPPTSQCSHHLSPTSPMKFTDLPPCTSSRPACPPAGAMLSRSSFMVSKRLSPFRIPGSGYK